MPAQIKLEVRKDDQEFAKMYGVADKALTLLAATLDEVLHIPQTTRQDQSVMRWTAYLGTMLEETGNAAAQLLVLDMPRAALILNRQVFEYSVRLAYLYMHPDKAEGLLDSMLYKVWQEAKAAPGFFEPEMRRKYEENFKQWMEDHPELESQMNEVGVKRMVEEIFGATFDWDYFVHLFASQHHYSRQAAWNH